MGVSCDWMFEMLSEGGERGGRKHASYSCAGRRRHARVVCDWSSVVCFSFSSRRRHTRFDCDWSSDVCSSDLSRVHAATVEKALKTVLEAADIPGGEAVSIRP